MQLFEWVSALSETHFCKNITFLLQQNKKHLFVFIYFFFFEAVQETLQMLCIMFSILPSPLNYNTLPFIMAYPVTMKINSEC